MLALPPVAPATGWRASTRLARDHYIRLDSNDYSVHPSVIGRRIEVIADLTRVRAVCDGRLVADHDRIWARHQTISDPEHAAAVKALRRHRVSSSAAWPTTTPRWASRWASPLDQGVGEDQRGGTTGRDLAAEVAYLTRALKAPTLRELGPAGRTRAGRGLDS